MQHFVRDARLIALILSLLLIFSGCTPAKVQQPTSQSSSQTIVRATEALVQAELAAVKSTVKVLREGQLEIEIPENHAEKVSVGDIVELDKEGLGILHFPHLLEVELFRSAKILLAESNQETDGTTFVKLNHLRGHIRVILNEQSPARLTLETDYALITTLEQGTEIIVCHSTERELTCIVVLKGAIEVIAQNKKEIIKAGEATYVYKDQTPFPAICAPEGIFLTWEEKFRSSAEEPAISKLVDGLPQQPCMVMIGSGSYEIGKSTADTFHIPLRSITLDHNYWIDTYEVTNFKYKKYLDHTGDQEPVGWPGDGEAHPVRGVSWDQASAYCSWAQKRLPTEEEWEVAGRGPGSDAPLFPWGNDPDLGRKLPLDGTYAVGSYPFNVSPFHVYDMVGNVWEWVGEPYDTIPEGYKMMRGGRFSLFQDLAYRLSAEPNDQRFIPYVGFRCAAEQPEER